MVISEALTFSKVENIKYRSYSCHSSTISLNTFTKYRGLVTKAVEAKVVSELPSKFALVFDGWTCENSSTHFLRCV